MIDTKTAAEKMGISPRRIRVLCEQGRIHGANKVGGVWVLPVNPAITPATKKRKN